MTIMALTVTVEAEAHKNNVFIFLQPLLYLSMNQCPVADCLDPHPIGTAFGILDHPLQEVEIQERFSTHQQKPQSAMTHCKGFVNGTTGHIERHHRPTLFVTVTIRTAEVAPFGEQERELVGIHTITTLGFQLLLF